VWLLSGLKVLSRPRECITKYPCGDGWVAQLQFCTCKEGKELVSSFLPSSEITETCNLSLQLLSTIQHVFKEGLHPSHPSHAMITSVRATCRYLSTVSTSRSLQHPAPPIETRAASSTEYRDNPPIQLIPRNCAFLQRKQQASYQCTMYMKGSD
jgi:hypothetical protein